MNSKVISIFVFLVFSLSAKAEELSLINEVMLQLGNEGYQVMFKDSNDCIYSGKASANTVGVSDVHIDRKVCIDHHGKTQEANVSLHWQAISEIRVNTFTGERVNLLTAGTKYEFQE